jgi:O-antigen/teichoic acid export membrane protein
LTARRRQLELTVLSAFLWLFATKIGLGVVVTLLSARLLSPADFAAFTQLLLFSAWLALIATGGTVNGLIRQHSTHQDDPDTRDAITTAAGLIWLSVTAVIIPVGFILARDISVFLTGEDTSAITIRWILCLTAVSGLAQLLCAMLSASGRIATSIAIQALGLMLAGVGVVWFPQAGRFEEALIAFAAGPAITLPLAFFAARPRLRWIPSAVKAQATLLIAHSAAHFALATVPPLLLFGGRWVYQQHFSLAMLALWLIANRISDIHTQIFGLYGTQVALPRLSGAQGSTAYAPELRRTFLVGVGVALPAPLLFLVAGPFLMTLFLPPSFNAASPFVFAYLVGDFLRAVAYMGMMGFLSQNRWTEYVLVELASVALIVLLVALSSMVGIASGPAFAYPLAHLLAALFVLYRFRNALTEKPPRQP